MNNWISSQSYKIFNLNNFYIKKESSEKADYPAPTIASYEILF
jgi:hypothetical protein